MCLRRLWVMFAAPAPETALMLPPEQRWDDTELSQILNDLKVHNFVVLDGFMGETNCSFLRKTSVAYGTSTSAPHAFDIIVERTRQLISSLKKRTLDFPEELQTTDFISINLSCLPPGCAGQPHHVDNPGGRGSATLTMTYYLQNDWDTSTCGGCLRLHTPHHDCKRASPEDDVLCDVAPRRDRLVVFFSDDRCPHAVLPVAREAPDSRYAAVLFFGERLYTPGSPPPQEEDGTYTLDWS